MYFIEKINYFLGYLSEINTFKGLLLICLSLVICVTTMILFVFVFDVARVFDELICNNLLNINHDLKHKNNELIHINSELLRINSELLRIGNDLKNTKKKIKWDNNKRNKWEKKQHKINSEYMTKEIAVNPTDSQIRNSIELLRTIVDNNVIGGQTYTDTDYLKGFNDA